MSGATLLPSALALALAGALALLAAGSSAATPTQSGGAAVKTAAATDVIEARWRRWRWGRWGGYRSGCHVAGGYYRPNSCW